MRLEGVSIQPPTLLMSRALGQKHREIVIIFLIACSRYFSLEAFSARVTESLDSNARSFFDPKSL